MVRKASNQESEWEGQSAHSFLQMGKALVEREQSYLPIAEGLVR